MDIDFTPDYSPNSDIWLLRRDWEHVKDGMLAQLNDRFYQFGLLDRDEFTDAIISLWSSEDMVALKLITQALEDLITSIQTHAKPSVMLDA